MYTYESVCVCVCVVCTCQCCVCVSISLSLSLAHDEERERGRCCKSVVARGTDDDGETMTMMMPMMTDRCARAHSVFVRDVDGNRGPPTTSPDVVPRGYAQDTVVANA